MATNATTRTTATALPSIPSEQTHLNTEKDVATFESSSSQIDGTEKVAETKTVGEITEQIKTPAIGITLALFLILNVSMFFVGITTTKDCPIKPIIPIYLAVAGPLGFLTKVIPIANRNKQLAILDRIFFGLMLVEFIWLILGSVWIYGIYKPNFNPALTPNYCDKTVYFLAFWLLTLNYIMLGLSLVVPCCIIFSCFCITVSLASKISKLSRPDKHQ